MCRVCHCFSTASVVLAGLWNPSLPFCQKPERAVQMKIRSICGLRVTLAERWNGVMERGTSTENEG